MKGYGLPDLPYGLRLRASAPLTLLAQQATAKEKQPMKQNTKLALRATTLALYLALSGAGFLACQEEKKGPLEKVGEKIDESVNDTKRAVEDAGD